MQTTTDRPLTRARSASRIEIALLYSAFALIGAVVFGTLTIHPF